MNVRCSGDWKGNVLAWVILPALVAGSATSVEPPAQEIWRESGFEGLSDGTIDDPAAAYISRRGVQLIDRLDINRDGFLDIFIGNGHGHTEDEDIFVYLNNGEEIDALSRQLLPAQGAVHGLVEDLNRDGYNDLVAVNSSGGMGFRVDTFVYYGGRDGFSVSRRTRLRAWRGMSAAAADWNGDGWTDLAIACANPAGEDGTAVASIIYWNGANGFEPSRVTELPGAGFWALAADLNGDTHTDLALAHEQEVRIYWGSGTALDVERPTAIALGARHLAAGDLDGDGHIDLVAVVDGDIHILPGSLEGPHVTDARRIPLGRAAQTAVVDLNRAGRADLVVTNGGVPANEYDNSMILWNDNGDLQVERATLLPTVSAGGISAGDLDRDGWPDLVISNARSLNQMSIQSFIYWNRGGRFRLGWKSMLDTRGSRANCIGDVNNDGLPDVVFFNFEGGRRAGQNPNVIYWGDGTRQYTERRSTRLPSAYNVGTVQADFNDDGWTDLGSVEDRHALGRPPTLHGVYVWFGGPDGFREERRIVLSVETLGSGLRAADLNRDGYLDLIVGAGEPGPVGRIGNVVFWGGANGFAAGRRQVIPIGMLGRAPVVADLDRDGHLDLAGGSFESGVYLVYGSSNGLRLDRIVTLLPDWTVLDVEAADLDRDGWLDLILPAIIPPDREGRMFIYYGSPDGYTTARVASLPHLDGHDPSVADFNQDGYLDIAVSNEGDNGTGPVTDYLYWGGPDGFEASRRLELPGESGAASIPADFDGDGWIDLLMVRHKRAGNPDQAGAPIAHDTDSFLFWNGPNGFDLLRPTPIPTSGPHSQLGRDPGNSYDRRLSARFTSVAHRPSNPSLKPVALAWQAIPAPRTAVRLQIRTAPTERELRWAAWMGPRGAGDWFEHEAGIPGAVVFGEWLQYRAELISIDGGNSPVLTEVTVTYR